MFVVKKFFFQQFYFQIVLIVSELCKLIYWIVVGKVFDYEQMLFFMVNVKWDVKEIMLQYNIYVDVLLKEFEQFNRRLNEVFKRV